MKKLAIEISNHIHDHIMERARTEGRSPDELIGLIVCDSSGGKIWNHAKNKLVQNKQIQMFPWPDEPDYYEKRRLFSVTKGRTMKSKSSPSSKRREISKAKSLGTVK